MPVCLGKVLKLLDGSTSTVQSTKDFSDLLYAKLGTDVRDWFDNYVESYHIMESTLENVSDSYEVGRMKCL